MCDFWFRVCGKFSLERRPCAYRKASCLVLVKDSSRISLKKAAVDRYYRLARTTPLRHVHNQLRLWLPLLALWREKCLHVP